MDKKYLDSTSIGNSVPRNHTSVCHDVAQKSYDTYNIEDTKLYQETLKQDFYSGDKVIDTSQSAFVKEKIPMSQLLMSTLIQIGQSLTLENTMDEMLKQWCDYVWGSDAESSDDNTQFSNRLKEFKPYVGDPSINDGTTSTTATEVCEENRRRARLGFPVPEKVEPAVGVQLFGNIDVNTRVVINPDYSSTYNEYPHYQDDVIIHTDDDTSVKLLKVPNGKSSSGGRVIAVLCASGQGNIRLHHNTDGNLIVIDSIAHPDPSFENVVDQSKTPYEPEVIFDEPSTRSKKAKAFSVRNGKMVPTGQYPSFMERPKNNKRKKRKK